MNKKFKLPRKRKKRFKKDRYVKSFKNYGGLYCVWRNYYSPELSMVQAMGVVLGQPDLDLDTMKWSFPQSEAKSLSSKELYEWYKEHYPNDKLKQHYSKQNIFKYYYMG